MWIRSREVRAFRERLLEVIFMSFRSSRPSYILGAIHVHYLNIKTSIVEEISTFIILKGFLVRIWRYEEGNPVPNLCSHNSFWFCDLDGVIINRCSHTCDRARETEQEVLHFAFSVSTSISWTKSKLEVRI